MWWCCPRIRALSGDKGIYNLDNGSAVLTGSSLRASGKDQYVTARDSLEYWEKQNAVIARGDAVAVNPQQKVNADTLTGYFRTDTTGSKKLYQVEGLGHVGDHQQGQRRALRQGGL